MNFFEGKTVLITGASGLIGSHLVDEFMSMGGGVNVIALGRNEEKLRKGFSDYLQNENFKYVAQDVCTAFDFGNEHVDFIFHAARLMSRNIYDENPCGVIAPNIIGTMNCLEYLRRQKEKTGKIGKFVLFSTVAVYGNNTEKDLVVTEHDTKVSDFLESKSAPYSQSKRMAEVMVLAYKKQYGVDVLIPRLGVVYGNSNGRFPCYKAFYEFIEDATNGKDIVVNGCNMPRRDNIYIDDVVSASLIVAQKGVSGEAYNISSNGELGNFAATDEVAQKVCDIANVMLKNKNVKVVRSKLDTAREPGLCLDNSKLKGLGWNLKYGLEDGIRKSIEIFEKR